MSYNYIGFTLNCLFLLWRRLWRGFLWLLSLLKIWIFGILGCSFVLSLAGFRVGVLRLRSLVLKCLDGAWCLGIVWLVFGWLICLGKIVLKKISLFRNILVFLKLDLRLWSSSVLEILWNWKLTIHLLRNLLIYK